MNYRHIYHAGNFADVFKHVTLCLLLDYLQQKGKPFCYIDTHAGIGLYDLSANEFSRSPEFENGIAKLLNTGDNLEICSRYLKIVYNLQKNDTLHLYPGSPMIATHFLSEDDRLILNELHPQDFASLKKNMKLYNNAHCHQRDAYEFLPAILPPKPKRALILIDPPYEKTSEYDDILVVLKKSLKRFETGIYMLWYPIVDDSHHKPINKIKTNIANPMIQYELLSSSKQSGLLGSGVLIINPPWKIESEIKLAISELQQLL